MTDTNYKKKLIEVAIPLEAINKASAREKSIRHGHPSTLHLWWARRPLATCRAVLFAQLVDDPSSHPDRFPTEEAQEKERHRLFKIIEDLVTWENSNNDQVLERARTEIRKSCDGALPPIYDPFSGGGSIPLEAQRLGLPAYGSDLNPVAVMIGKAMIEIPPKFKNTQPVHPGGPENLHYRNAEGLAEDVKYYGNWMRERAFERIGHIYPKVDMPKEYGGSKATAIAWIWARTVTSPNPALGGAMVPLIKSSWISKNKKNPAWVDIKIDGQSNDFSFEVRKSGKPDLDGTVRKTAAVCAISGEAIPLSYIRDQGCKVGLGQRLMAVVYEGPNGKEFITPPSNHENSADIEKAENAPEANIDHWSGCTNCVVYGFDTFQSLFTNRQSHALTTFSDLVLEARTEVLENAKHSGMTDDEISLEAGGTNASAYADAVAVYLAIGVDRLADRCSSFCGWDASRNTIRNTFARHAIPMVWEFSEVNPFSKSTGNWTSCIEWIYKVLKGFVPSSVGQIAQENASDYSIDFPAFVLCTDPPYYDNIPYSNLSDYFYIWLRRSLRTVMPEAFKTLTVPKSQELVANRFRHGGSDKAEKFFMSGIGDAIAKLAHDSDSNYPATIFYAFKQSEVEQDGLASKGWSAFLRAVIDAGYSIVGTWPVRTELSNRMRSQGSNALATSVVLVCRKRDIQSEIVTRAEFIRALKYELPPALHELQRANITPVDMPQASIGPGIGIFSRYTTVLESDDSPMTVKTALQIINRELDTFLTEQEGEFDADTRFAVTWFEQNGMKAGDFGDADNLARARGLSVDSVKHAGVVESSAGKVRLLARNELEEDWSPANDTHLTVWECTQYLIRALQEEGEYAAAVLLKQMGLEMADAARDLAYRLFDICDKQGQAKEASAYNSLIAVWSDLTAQAATVSDTDIDQEQISMF